MGTTDYLSVLTFSLNKTSKNKEKTILFIFV